MRIRLAKSRRWLLFGFLPIYLPNGVMPPAVLPMARFSAGTAISTASPHNVVGKFMANSIDRVASSELRFSRSMRRFCPGVNSIDTSRAMLWSKKRFFPVAEGSGALIAHKLPKLLVCIACICVTVGGRSATETRDTILERSRSHFRVSRVEGAGVDQANDSGAPAGGRIIGNF